MPALRPVSGALALALQSGVPLWSADCFTVTLIDESTVFRWTTWDQDLIADGYTFSSRSPWIKRSKWSVVNTMAVPSMDVTLLALNTDFNGGAQIKTQIHNGLFDGAVVNYERAFMTAPGVTTTIGLVGIFDGIAGGINLDGSKAVITCKGGNNPLNQNAPRNVFQTGCLHAFCDVGCTLSRGSFTTSYVVGASPTRYFIPWDGAAPGNYALYKGGTITVTSGPSSGQTRTVADVDATGITLAYPLYYTPAAGDAFTGFEGCDKTKTRCEDLSNDQNFRAFPYVPPPTTAL